MLLLVGNMAIAGVASRSIALVIVADRRFAVHKADFEIFMSETFRRPVVGLEGLVAVVRAVVRAVALAVAPAVAPGRLGAVRARSASAEPAARMESEKQSSPDFRGVMLRMSCNVDTNFVVV